MSEYVLLGDEGAARAQKVTKSSSRRDAEGRKVKDEEYYRRKIEKASLKKLSPYAKRGTGDVVDSPDNPLRVASQSALSPRDKDVKRWTDEETKKLKEMRSKLKAEMVSRKQLPDVVGDRRLLRFLRGQNMDVEKACAQYSKFLQWRDLNKVDEVRDDILYGGYKSIMNFPYAQVVMSLVPQVVLAHDALDLLGNPIGMERFCFDPVLVLKEIKKEEYIRYMIYMLEYKMLVLEQMSDAAERVVLQKNPHTSKPYGVVLQCRIFRDFTGFGIGHIGVEGRTVITWILEIAVDNYPELLYRSHMVNVPWVFNTIWYFVKGMLDDNTIKKVTINTTDYLDALRNEVPLDAIPQVLGGHYEPKDVMFEFDISRDGPFFYAQAPIADNILWASEISKSIAQPMALQHDALTDAPLSSARNEAEEERRREKERRRRKAHRRRRNLEAEAAIKNEMRCNLVSLQRGCNIMKLF